MKGEGRGRGVGGSFRIQKNDRVLSRRSGRPEKIVKGRVEELNGGLRERRRSRT